MERGSPSLPYSFFIISFETAEISEDISGMSTTKKNKKIRKSREGCYKLLTDAAYKRRGWTRNGVPTMERVKKLGLDWIPEVVEIVKKNGNSEPPK